MSAIPHVSRVMTALATAALLGVGAPAAGQDRSPRQEVEFAAFASFEEVETFVKDFQEAIRERSCFKVSALTRFPVRVNWVSSVQNGPSWTKYLYNRTALCRYFPEMFDADTRRRILNQDIFRMAAGWRGLTFGDGAVWVRSFCQGCPTELRMIGVNILLPEGSMQDAPSPTRRSP